MPNQKHSSNNSEFNDGWTDEDIKEALKRAGISSEAEAKKIVADKCEKEMQQRAKREYFNEQE